MRLGQVNEKINHKRPKSWLSWPSIGKLMHLWFMTYILYKIYIYYTLLIIWFEKDFNRCCLYLIFSDKNGRVWFMQDYRIYIISSVRSKI